MMLLCGQCGRDFESNSRIVTHKDHKSGSEERYEIPTEEICPDCRRDKEEID